MVILDVVYNHFGPDGNYLGAYAPDFFHPERMTPWGGAIAYERAPVRRFFIDNALYWLGEFRFDGLRLDAADHIHDPDARRRDPRRARPRPCARPSPAGRSTSPPRTTATSPACTSAAPTARPASTPPSGTTTCTTSPTSLATGETEGYYARLRRGPLGQVRPRPRRGLRLPGRALAPRRRRPARRPLRPPAAHRLRRFPAEPRPDRQPRLRRAPDRPSRPAPPSRL